MRKALPLTQNSNATIVATLARSTEPVGGAQARSRGRRDGLVVGRAVGAVAGSGNRLMNRAPPRSRVELHDGHLIGRRAVVASRAVVGNHPIYFELVSGVVQAGSSGRVIC